MKYLLMTEAEFEAALQAKYAQGVLDGSGYGSTSDMDSKFVVAEVACRAREVEVAGTESDANGVFTLWRQK